MFFDFQWEYLLQLRRILLARAYSGDRRHSSCLSVCQFSVTAFYLISTWEHVDVRRSLLGWMHWGKFCCLISWVLNLQILQLRGFTWLLV